MSSGVAELGAQGAGPLQVLGIYGVNRAYRRLVADTTFGAFVIDDVNDALYRVFHSRCSRAVGDTEVTAGAFVL